MYVLSLAAAGGLTIGWWIVIPTLVMIVLVFLGLILLGFLRDGAERNLQELYQRDVGLYLERLENNRRLALVFRRPVLLLYRLKGYMKAGRDEQIRSTIAQLDGMRLAPRDELQFLQDRLSYFVSVRDRDEALASRDKMIRLLERTKADREERYQKILRDADQIVRVYLDRDVSLLPELVREAGETAASAQRGILQYRAAILYHFAGDEEKTEIYLKRASKNLKNSYYSVMIKEALEDHTALERQ